MAEQRIVLIIEDSESDRSVFRRYLFADSEISYQILETDSAAEGLNLCRVQVPDGILLGIQLSDFNGFEFLTQLKAQTDGNCPPVIMVSGDNDAVTATSAFKNGVEDYLVKGLLTPDDVRLAMRSAIENAKLRRKLQHSEESFRASIETMLDCFGIHTAIRDDTGQIIDFRIDYYNQAALESNRLTAKDVGKTARELFPAYRDSDVFASHCRVVETGEPMLEESLEYSDRFGGQHLSRAYEVRASKLGDGLVMAWRDVSDRLRAEDERQRSEETARQQFAEIEAIYTAAPIGLCFINTDFKFVRINERLAEINGLPVSEHIGRTLREVVPEMVDQLEPIYRQVIESGKPILDLEVSGINRAQPGVERHWLVSYYPQKDTDDRVFGINVMVLEITDRKQAETERGQLLREAQAAREEAEAANRSKDELLMIVAHELRSPLNSIFGWARLLQTKPSDQATLTRALQSIERSAKTQSQLIEDLLDISRMVQGNLRMDRVLVNLPFVIEAAIDMIRPLAESKQIQIKSNIDHAANEVLGDSNRLQQVIWNLLTNAIKFTPENGQVEITLTQKDSQAEICVKDTGKGINANFLPYVFDRFRQAQTNVPRSQDGLGLGLAIVRELIELHNGTIQAESQGDAQGATFTARLPLVNCCLPLSDPQNGASEGFDQLQILVVDDEPDSLEFVKFLLENEGATITTATSADEAIAAFQQLTPTLIISDIAMPLKDGYEMLREIRALEAGHNVPAIALTAYVDEDVRQQAFAAGYQIHLPKPLDIGQLIEAIGALTKQCPTQR
ncbi:PAS domain S-box protein [Phormidesmis priestleyi ULC007]|uniref:histidine kinase n=1 Tax=Phormidesmis priestleyi ULC007 TaxID=1920490 RepID=A0A2T1DCV2_9CYAN|nr:response regulator [Phormidesmis priestleyi]PSB18352.1 PAS domain S-box protein [Phormidesmis priestleyi ULC007]PZO46568.1 MAG: PAS domain S-box protein [Phormidesmis priestleyi]